MIIETSNILKIESFLHSYNPIDHVCIEGTCMYVDYCTYMNLFEELTKNEVLDT